jgi:predicted porin
MGGKLRKVLICAAAISSIAGVAHADELTDLKTQSQQLQQQNQILMQKINSLEQREQKLETVQAQQQAAPPPSAPVSGPAASSGGDDSLTWHGITVYGGLDMGVMYQSAGTPLNSSYGPGVEEIISKNSNHSLVTLAPNELSYSNIGLKGTEELMPGLSALFNLQQTFTLTGGRVSNGLESLVNQNGVALNKQISGGDSSRAGQLFDGAAYFGLSSPTWGTITAGRQNSITLDGVIAYDPNGASNAFSLIGYSGTTAGTGDTQDARLDSSVKYRVNLGPIRVGALAQLQGFGNLTTKSAYEADIGTDYAGFSFDAIYSQVYDAISASSIAAPTPAQTNTLAGTVSDNTSWMLLARYNIDDIAKIYAGSEHIQFDNPQNPLAAPTEDLGFTLSSVNDAAFTQQKVLQISWAGVKYNVTPDFDVTGAAYYETQNSFATGKLAGCSSKAQSSACSGNEEAYSLVADYRFTKRFDVYAGAMYSEVNGGLSNGFLHDSTIDPTVGARFRF